LFLFSSSLTSAEEATFVQTPYKEPKVMFEFYFDEPNKINSALYWIRSFINPLTENPYNMAPEFMDIKVIIHGTEIVTLAKKNYIKYKTIVERMKYYSQLGVEFRVCALAATDFGYTIDDFQSFVKVVPSAITEIGHWQQEGYAIIKPEILEKKFSVEELR
ncbi:MAG: DsrE family protein, partial [Gammaproteobacteria bacterium]|nr:DsrE family protein [Gammaproteobacteria bacterium]